MNTVERTISFCRCPVGRHKGDRWEKLSRIDASRPVVLRAIEYMWSDVFYRRECSTTGMLEGVEQDLLGHTAKTDTFQDITRAEWTEIIRYFYKLDEVFGMVLYLEQDGKVITTFRVYKPDTVRYYRDNIDKEFWIQEDVRGGKR